MTAMWRKADEIKVFGMYIIFRTDDNILGGSKQVDLYDGYRVKICQGPDNVFYILSNGGMAQELSTLDTECRFFGPITEDQLHFARDLVIALTGHLK